MILVHNIMVKVVFDTKIITHGVRDILGVPISLPTWLCEITARTGEGIEVVPQHGVVISQT